MKNENKINGLVYEPEKFKDMPKPIKAPATKLSWEDVYGKFLEDKIQPTRNQIIKAFERAGEYIDKATFEYGMEGFWQCVQDAVSNFSEEDKEN